MRSLSQSLVVTAGELYDRSKLKPQLITAKAAKRHQARLEFLGYAVESNLSILSVTFLAWASLVGLAAERLGGSELGPVTWSSWGRLSIDNRHLAIGNYGIVLSVPRNKSLK
jgi:hypothetical protein